MVDLAAVDYKPYRWESMAVCYQQEHKNARVSP
jgi:hypothetical protein